MEDAIKMQIKRILENNENYVRLIHECKNIVDRYAISIMAIEKYLTGPHGLGSKLEYAAFLGVLIKELIKEGKSVDWAWNAVCCDSVELGNYWNSENSKHKFEVTGSREICGFCDLANTFKILAWDVEVDSFWMASGYYFDDDNIWPISEFTLFWNRNTVRICSVGWPVISYVA